MESQMLMDALVQVKRMGNLCNEALDLSQQMAEAMDRSDYVSLQMLVAMRQEPINKMQVADQALRQQLIELPPEDSRHLAALLNGGEGGTKEEKVFAAQVAANSRMLKRVLELDGVLNQKINKETSKPTIGGVEIKT